MFLLFAVVMDRNHDLTAVCALEPLGSVRVIDNGDYLVLRYTHIDQIS